MRQVVCLSLFTVVLVLLFSPPARSTSKYDVLISQATLKYQPAQYPDHVAWHKARIKCESDFNTLAVSPVGAKGLCQFMPATEDEMGIDAFIPEQSIPAMVRYTNSIASYLKVSFENPPGGVREQRYVDAAYNTGMGRVRRLMRAYSNNWSLIYYNLPMETRNYVDRIQRWKTNYERAV